MLLADLDDILQSFVVQNYEQWEFKIWWFHSLFYLNFLPFLLMQFQWVSTSLVLFIR